MGKAVVLFAFLLSCGATRTPEPIVFIYNDAPTGHCAEGNLCDEWDVCCNVSKLDAVVQSRGGWFIYEDTVDQEETFYFEAPDSLMGADTIISVTYEITAKQSLPVESRAARFRIRIINDQNQYSTQTFDATENMIVHGLIFATPPGGGAWTWAKLDDYRMVIHFARQASNGADIEIHRITRKIEWR